MCILDAFFDWFHYLFLFLKFIVYSLNFVLCLHLAINSLLFFNNLSGNLCVKICIFSSKHKLHLPSKLFGVFDFFKIDHSISGVNPLFFKHQKCFDSAVSHGYLSMAVYLTDKMKRSFFQAAVVSILLYGCTTWTLTKRLEKRLDGNYTRMLRAILNKSWRQHPTKHQLYGHLPPITKTIQVRRARYAGHSWRSRDDLICDVLLWTPTYGRAKAGRPARTYIQQLCEDTGYSPEDLQEWRERVWDIRAGGTTWWWWWWWYMYLALNNLQR